MTFCFYMNCVSAHQLPLAREVARLVGRENFVYVDAEADAQPLQTVHAVSDLTVVKHREAPEQAENADVVVTGMRDFDLIERRARKGLTTFYYSERWFKPLAIRLGRLSFSLPGRVRMLVPGYRRMARRFVAWTRTDSRARVLAVGPWAKGDFLRLGVPAEKIVDWGYFVEPGAGVPRTPRTPGSELKVLWVGRMLPLKRVDTIVRALREVLRRNPGAPIRLTLVGDGPERTRLERLAAGLPVDILPPVPMGEVRRIMQAHDLFVFASNAFEGWGAVVSEALEEGMSVVGSREAGACPALLPAARLFRSGNVRTLAKRLEEEYNCQLPPCSLGDGSARRAAERVVELVKR